MASPFKFFRTHQTGMMVVLVILSMLLFTLDALFTAEGANFWLLGLLLGGAVFGVSGIGSGRWLQWGIGGAALGALLGFVMPDFVRRDGVISTSFGVISNDMLNDLQEQRMISNRFLAMATEEALGQGAGRFAAQFGFNHSPREDLLFGRLMNEEAEELGIVVTDAMVTEFINEVTQDKLSRESFADIRRSLSYGGRPVDDETLFGILRRQLQAMLAFNVLSPAPVASPPSPEVYWEFFRRLNVRQQMNVSELSVDAFLDEVDEPSDVEVEQLFAAYRNKFAGQDGPGTPGFRLPGRIRVAWLELNEAAVEESLPEITDDEIQSHYDAFRETRYRTVVIPDPARDKSESDSEEAEADGVSDPESESNVEQPAEETEPDGEAVPDGDDSSDAPDDSVSSEEDAADSDAVEVLPTDDSVDDDDGADDGSAAAAGVADDNEGGDAVDGDPSASETSGETPDDPLLTIPDADPLLIPDADTEAGSEDTSSTPPMEFEYRELDDALRIEIRDELLVGRVAQTIEGKMSAASAFLQSLRNQRTERRAEIFREDPARYSQQGDAGEPARAELRERLAKFTPEILAKMRDYANENGFVYVDTPLLTPREMLNKDDYPLGSAVDPDQNPFAPAAQSQNVAVSLFSSFSDDPEQNSNSMFLPEQAKSPADFGAAPESHYLYWAVGYSEPHIPTLDEPGVRDDVVLTLKRQAARSLLNERADRLETEVRDGLAKEGDDRVSMAATLEGETITGEDDSATLLVRMTQPFSWLPTSQAPAMSFNRRPRVELSRIRFSDGSTLLDDVGNDFMRTVFDELRDEEVGVVPNFDLTKYYIVQVTNRFPTPEIGMDGLRDRFAREGELSFPNTPIESVMQQEIQTPVIVEWERSVWRKYGVDPDSEPE